MSVEVGAARPRRRFSVGLILGLLVGLAIGITAWVGWTLQRHWTRGERVESFLTIPARQPVLNLDGSDKESYEDYLRRKGQIASLASSPFIIQKTLDNPKITQLSLIRGQSEPALFLQQRLYVKVLPDSSMVQVGMQGPPGSANDMVAIVDQLVRELLDYVKEIQAREFNHRVMALRSETEELKQRTRSLATKIQQAKSVGDDANLTGIDEFDVLLAEQEHAICLEMLEQAARAHLVLRMNDRSSPSVLQIAPAQLIQ